MEPAPISRRRRVAAVVAGVVVLAALLVAGIAWIGWYVVDNIGAPGPPATGSGPCGSADSVNIQLAFADGHLVEACTRDRPTCANSTVSVGMPQGQTTASQFTLDNQLRSSSRRYILFIRIDSVLQSDTAERVVQIDPVAVLGPPGYVAPEPGPHAELQVTPRDPEDEGSTAASGTITVSSAHGVVRGRIDGSFSSGAGRPDRPQPSPHWSPVTIRGDFTCNL